MQKRKMILVLLIPLLFACDTDMKPNRVECIAGFKLDWANVTVDTHSVRNSLGIRPTGDRYIKELAAMTISADGENLYLQFKENCAMKDAISLRLIEFWRTEISELPKFTSMEGPILPSPETIDVTGPYWRDE